MKYSCINSIVGFSSFVIFVFFYDTNNLLKNRITSGMHIYSSPRILSVNLGSVSTKHEQHLLPVRLYPQQIWHHVHSFLSLFFLFMFFSSNHLHISYKYILFWHFTSQCKYNVRSE